MVCTTARYVSTSVSPMGISSESSALLRPHNSRPAAGPDGVLLTGGFAPITIVAWKVASINITGDNVSRMLTSKAIELPVFSMLI